MTNSQNNLSAYDIALITAGIEKVFSDTGWGAINVFVKDYRVSMLDAIIRMKPGAVPGFFFMHLAPPTAKEVEKSVLAIYQDTGWGEVSAEFANGDIVLLHVTHFNKPGKHLAKKSNDA